MAGRAALVVSALAVVGSIVAACGGDASGSAAAGSPGAGGAASTPAATSAGGDARLVVDAGLLRYLPASVAGVAMQPSPESAAGMVTDPSLARTASAIAVGVVVAAGNSRGDDLAISTVIQLRPGVYTDQFYQGWRDAYDRAACDPAGGVASHVQQLIGPHAVEVTVCSQGARTYHTHLAGDRLVSITAVGDRKFGDLVMAGLRQ